MSARAVQISLDSKLLERIDKDPQARREGRSAFIRDAVRLYLQAKHRRAVDQKITRAFRGKSDELLDDVVGLLEAQQWPDE